jgi:hypothetical protein
VEIFIFSRKAASDSKESYFLSTSCYFRNILFPPFSMHSSSRHFGGHGIYFARRHTQAKHAGGRGVGAHPATYYRRSQEGEMACHGESLVAA